ncbi:NUDIX domain-containing protein [Kineosporia babensis]|uniref:NUDIX domain-containing protein n=1 Tax=Kineosporia babensis TaxID=499548 RepID=A0A9X1SXS0_9ACTN|nr:NUDIX domain-containing protein [Kineosporia babensis]
MKVRRARVVTLAPTGRVAMIERYVRGHRYLSVPGGRMEPGETPEQTAIREIEEELGLEITLAGRLPDHDGQAYFIAVVPDEVELQMSGPEMKHSSRNNRYTPRWVDAATLDGLPLRQPVRPLITTAALAVAATMSVVEPVAEPMGDASPGLAEPGSPETAKGEELTDVGAPVEQVAAPESVEAAEPVADLVLPPLSGPRADYDPAAATFTFGHSLRRRFTFRARGRSRDERVGVRR